MVNSYPFRAIGRDRRIKGLADLVSVIKYPIEITLTAGDAKQWRCLLKIGRNCRIIKLVTPEGQITGFEDPTFSMRQKFLGGRMCFLKGRNLFLIHGGPDESGSKHAFACWNTDRWRFENQELIMTCDRGENGVRYYVDSKKIYFFYPESRGDFEFEIGFSNMDDLDLVVSMAAVLHFRNNIH